MAKRRHPAGIPPLKPQNRYQASAPSPMEGMPRATTSRATSRARSVVTGPDLAATYVLAQELEWVCELYLRTRAVGTPKILSDEQIEAVDCKIRDTGYGQHAPAQED